MKKIVLTGGGTAGHVTPNIALIPELIKRNYDIHYIGSETGIEKRLIEEYDIPYYAISTGKFRRYFDIKNFTDPFRVVKGIREAASLMKELKPDVVFSKGGFVSVPVVLAADRKKIPCVIHESDMTPGLANKICIPHAVKVCTNFPEAAANIPDGKAVVSGTPIRSELYKGNRTEGLKFCGFTDNKPVIMVVGGSLGAAAVNRIVRESLPELLKKYNVIHLCGEGKLDSELDNMKGYAQFEYVKKELSDMMAAADLVISRAGANAICELLALKKPNILIPLPQSQSRGDQVLNAQSFKKQGYSAVLNEETLTPEKLVTHVDRVFNEKEKYVYSMRMNNNKDAIQIICDILDEFCGDM